MRVESSVGISPTLHAALHTVEVHGPITPGRLAEHENVRKPTMTRTIASLLEEGLIERTPDPLDGRVSWLKVTPAGAKLLQRARQRQTEFLAARVKKLSDDDRAHLSRSPVVRTPGGGAHVYCRLTDALKGTRYARDSSGKCLIETRGDGDGH